MMLLLRAALVLWLAFTGPALAEWRADVVSTPDRVTALEIAGTEVRVAIKSNWYQVLPETAKLVPSRPPSRPAVPVGALPDGRIAIGQGALGRAWLAAPTSRYRHGILGDTIEAGSLTIERRDGRQGSVVLGPNAVFEDLSPRIATLDGVDRILVVKSYLDRGSALAVVDADVMAIIAETPPIGRPHAWLNPAGIADFDGNGTTDIAIVRQPHVVGRLELWSWQDGLLKKSAEVANVANHFIGSKVLGMSWTADFDADGHPDLAVPGFDRLMLRIIAFAPHVRDIARVQLPARIVTNIGSTMLNGRPALLAGLEDGRLIVIHN